MRIIFTGIISILLCTLLVAQQNQNVTLLGSVNVSPRHSGSWSYVAAGGEEYALVGSQTGTAVYTIDDPGNMQQVGFITGPNSRWREITVLGDYAYVTTEGFSGSTGMQIINLSNLPTGVTLEGTYSTNFGTAHIIGRDIYSDSAYVYVMGGGASGGARILDVSNPVNPVEVGVYAPYYIHDAHIRGDRMYAAALSNGLDIVDISDKSNPVFLAKITHPQDFTHSSWTLNDGKHIFVTDEVDGLTARIWNIEDLSNITLVAEYSANLQSLVHNPYIRDDLVFISHNTEGLRVLDVADPTLPVEVGFYDTWSGPSGGFEGLWSACPYFPSGKIIGGDRTAGLLVWSFNGTHAGRLYGTVRDTLTGVAIPNATLTFLQTGTSAVSAADGSYKIGELPSGEGLFTLEISAANYETRSIELSLQSGDSLSLDIALSDPTAVAIEPRDDRPAGFQLEQNYPNPFNPETRIRFHLAGSGRVQLAIYNLLGQKIAQLLDDTRDAGSYEVSWDGRDSAGRAVASGTYLYRLNTDDHSSRKRMTLLR